jgi:hypothetical protein
LSCLFRSSPRAAEKKHRLIFGKAIQLGELGRVESIQGHEVNARDMNFGMLGGRAHIQKMQQFTLLAAAVKLFRRDRLHDFPYIAIQRYVNQLNICSPNTRSVSA